MMALHERKPFPYTRLSEVKNLLKKLKILIFAFKSAKKAYIHIIVMACIPATDPYEIYPNLNVEDDGGHAFYLGVEHARAQIAWQLGKRYEQDEELDWGVSTKSSDDDLNQFKEAGTTMHTTKRSKNQK